VNRRYFAITPRAVAIVLPIVAAFRIAIAAARFGTSNPNLKAIAEIKKSGVEFFVCGQYLAAEKIGSEKPHAGCNVGDRRAAAPNPLSESGICGAELLRAYDGSEQSFFQIEKLFL
jgi:hypothetical protein